MLQWLHAQGAALDAANKMGLQAIHYACCGDQLEVVQWLHAQGAALEAQTATGSVFLVFCNGRPGL